MTTEDPRIGLMELLFTGLATTTAVLLPACCSTGAQRTTHLRVAQFGAVGAGKTDDRAAIQCAINAAVKTGRGSTVLLGAGKVYRLAQYRAAVGALIVSGARGLTIDGAGSTLLCHPSNRPLAIHASENISVRDLILDYDPLPFTQGRMQTVDPEAGIVEFEADPGYTAPMLGDKSLYNDFKDSDCVFVRADRKFTHSWLRLSEVTEPRPGLFRCRFHGSPTHVAKQLRRTQVGDFIVVKMKFPKGEPLRAPDGRFIATSVGNINVAFSNDVTLSHITSYAAPSMTFNAYGSEGIVLDHCAVIRKPGTDRLIAGQSDGCHLKSLTVMPKILNCRFEALMDDSINVKISTERVLRVEGRRVLVGHGDILYNDTVVKPGDEMELYDYDGKRHLGFGKVTSAERASYRRAWLTFEEEPAGLAPGDVMYHRPITPVEIRGVEFGSQLKTAIVTHPPGNVTDCVFDDVAYGVHAFVNGPIEGCMPREIRVHNCTFIRNTIAALALAVPSLQAAPPAEFTLAAEGCRFVLGGGKGRLLSAYNVRGISLADCAAVFEDDRKLDDVIHTRGCTEVDTTGIASQTIRRSQR